MTSHPGPLRQKNRRRITTIPPILQRPKAQSILMQRLFSTTGKMSQQRVCMIRWWGHRSRKISQLIFAMNRFPTQYMARCKVCRYLILRSRLAQAVNCRQGSTFGRHLQSRIIWREPCLIFPYLTDRSLKQKQSPWI